VLLEAERDRGEEILKQLGDVQLPSALGLGFTPGEEGSYLGEAAYELLKALAIVSGPWAPIDIEQRANAFAAAFLMPSSLLLSALQKEGGDPSDPETLARVARRLRVSLTSLADRLRNLRLISHEEADDLKLGARIAWERLQRDGDQTSDQVPFDGH
jgi:hypothetical protein